MTKIHKKLKTCKQKYLTLPMLLQEGGQGRCHLKNLVQHMETALVLEIVVPTTSRIHHHTHSELTHRRPSEGKYLPT